MIQIIEVKLGINEKLMKSKCEWIIESWKAFDVKLDGSSPFESLKRFGINAKNAIEDKNTFQSQFNAWINDQQVCLGNCV